MNYNQAAELVNNNRHLIGRRYRGGRIDELIIRPTNVDEFNQFERLYLNSLDAVSSIEPFLECDLTVNAVCDKNRIRANGVFFTTNLENLLDETLPVNL